MLISMHVHDKAASSIIFLGKYGIVFLLFDVFLLNPKLVQTSMKSQLFTTLIGGIKYCVNMGFSILAA